MNSVQPAKGEIQKNYDLIETAVATIVMATAVIKVIFFNNPMGLIGDLVFLSGLMIFRSLRALVVFILCTTFALPSFGGIDRVLDGPFLIDAAILRLAWLALKSTEFTGNLKFPKFFLFCLSIYGGLVLSTLLGGGALQAGLLMTGRYIVLFIIFFLSVMTWVRVSNVTYLDAEEILFRSLRAALCIYVVVFSAQFVLPETYDKIFISSDGVREGLRVAYHIHTYLPVLILALLYSVVEKKNKNLPFIYKSISWPVWLVVAVAALLATGSRLPLLQLLVIAMLFMFVKSFKSFMILVFTFSIGIAFSTLPIFSSIVERMSGIWEADGLLSNMLTRTLPAISDILSMSDVELIIGKGLDHKFYVPWFALRDDNINPYVAFIDQLWATVFVQCGLVGVFLILCVFWKGLRFLFTGRHVLDNAPAIKFMVVFLLFSVHGFSNLAYSKDIYIAIAFIGGVMVALKQRDTSKPV